MNYSKNALVGIIMGSSSDARIMKGAAEILDHFGIKHEDQIISAHRTPSRISEYASYAEKNKFRVIIAGAGGAAHLPGMVSSNTIIPVIAVPVLVYNDKEYNKGSKSPSFKFSAFGGMDSLLSISEMPTGSPIVTVGVNKSQNAGMYAVRILANEFSELQKKLKDHKKTQYDNVVKESEKLRKNGLTNY